MDLVDEEHLAFIQRAEDGGEVARVLDCRSGRDAHWNSQLIGDDHCQCCLAQSGRACEQDVVRRHSPFLGCRQEEPHLLLEARLPDEVIEGCRAQLFVGELFVLLRLCGDHAQGVFRGAEVWLDAICHR